MAGKRAVAVVGAIVGPVLVWVVARVAGADLVVNLDGVGPTPVGLPFVVGSAAIGSLAGLVALVVLERISAKARTWWTVGALVVLAVSFVGPVTAAGASVSTRVVLTVMHVVLAVVLIPGLRRTVTDPKPKLSRT